MNRTIISILAIVCLFHSCGQKNARQGECYYSSGKYYPQTENVVNLTEKDLPKVEWFVIEKIDIPDKYANSVCYVYHDSILFCINNNSTSYKIAVLKFNTNTVVAEYFKHGYFVAGKLRGHYFNVVDSKHKAVMSLCVDSIVSKRGNYEPEISHYTSLSLLDFVYFNDSAITWANSQYIDGFGMTGIPNFVQSDAKTGNPLAQYPQNDDFQPEIAMQRTIALNGTHYMEFWQNFPVINIYNEKFQIEKQYRDTKFKDIDLYVEDNCVEEDGVAMECFEFGCQTDKYVMVNNYRSSVSCAKYQTILGDCELGKNHEIWAFDTDCNLVRRMRCKNLKGQVMGLSYCDESGSLYMNVIDEKNDIAFYKCIFKK